MPDILLDLGVFFNFFQFFFVFLRKALAICQFIRYNDSVIEKEVQAIMAKCSCCDKGVAFGIKVSHSHRRSNRTWNPNVKRVKAIVDGSPKYIYACTRCLRSGKVTRAV